MLRVDELHVRHNRWDAVKNERKVVAIQLSRILYLQKVFDTCHRRGLLFSVPGRQRQVQSDMELSASTVISATISTNSSSERTDSEVEIENPPTRQGLQERSIYKQVYGVSILMCNLLTLEMTAVAFAKAAPVSTQELVWLYIWGVFFFVMSIEWILLKGQQHSLMLHLVCHTCIFFASLVITIEFVQDGCPTDRWLSIHAFASMIAEIAIFLFASYKVFASGPGFAPCCTAM